MRKAGKMRFWQISCRSGKEKAATFMFSYERLPRLLAFLSLTIASFVTLLAATAPEVEWEKTFGGANVDVAYSVQQTSDSGYIIAGGTYSYGAGSCDIWLVKTNGDGTVEWSKTFGGARFDLAYSVQQTTDGGYIVAGCTESYGAGQKDFWLVKVDPEGNQQWSKTFGGRGDDKAKCVQQTSDGGYVIVGYTESYGAGGADFWLVKVDSEGNQQWSKTFGGADDDGAHSVQQTSDGGYIVAGATYSYGAGGADFWLVKVDSEGNQQWSKTFGGADDDGAYSVQQTTDGSYIMAGSTLSYGAGQEDFWLVKVDADGNEQWNRTFGGVEDDLAWSVHQTSDGGYIIAGYTSSYGAGSIDIYVVKLNPEIDTTPPSLITDFNASDGEDGQSTLTWTNPPDADLAEVVVRRKTGGYPADHTDGELVYRDTSPTPGQAISHTDTGLINGTTYYYAVFSRDASGNWNDTVQPGKNADTATPEIRRSITVISPNGGEEWPVGSTQEIRWESQNAGAYVKIEYSTDGGSTWKTVTDSTENDGSFSWVVPNTPSTHCRVKITSYEYPAVLDISDGEFAIQSLWIIDRKTFHKGETIEGEKLRGDIHVILYGRDLGNDRVEIVLEITPVNDWWWVSLPRGFISLAYPESGIEVEEGELLCLTSQVHSYEACVPYYSCAPEKYTKVPTPIEDLSVKGIAQAQFNTQFMQFLLQSLFNAGVIAGHAYKWKDIESLCKAGEISMDTVEVVGDLLDIGSFQIPPWYETGPEKVDAWCFRGSFPPEAINKLDPNCTDEVRFVWEETLPSLKPKGVVARVIFKIVDEAKCGPIGIGAVFDYEGGNVVDLRFGVSRMFWPTPSPPAGSHWEDGWPQCITGADVPIDKSKSIVQPLVEKEISVGQDEAKATYRLIIYREYDPDLRQRQDLWIEIEGPLDIDYEGNVCTKGIKAGVVSLQYSENISVYHKGISIRLLPKGCYDDWPLLPYEDALTRYRCFLYAGNPNYEEFVAIRKRAALTELFLDILKIGTAFAAGTLGGAVTGAAVSLALSTTDMAAVAADYANTINAVHLDISDEDIPWTIGYADFDEITTSWFNLSNVGEFGGVVQKIPMYVDDARGDCRAAVSVDLALYDKNGQLYNIFYRTGLNLTPRLLDKEFARPTLEITVTHPQSWYYQVIPSVSVANSAATLIGVHIRVPEDSQSYFIPLGGSGRWEAFSEEGRKIPWSGKVTIVEGVKTGFFEEGDTVQFEPLYLLAPKDGQPGDIVFFARAWCLDENSVYTLDGGRFQYIGRDPGYDVAGDRAPPYSRHQVDPSFSFLDYAVYKYIISVDQDSAQFDFGEEAGVRVRVPRLDPATPFICTAKPVSEEAVDVPPPDGELVRYVDVQATYTEDVPTVMEKEKAIIEVAILAKEEYSYKVTHPTDLHVWYRTPTGWGWGDWKEIPDFQVHNGYVEFEIPIEDLHGTLFAITVTPHATVTDVALVTPHPVPPEGCIFWLNLPDDVVEATLKIFDVDGALLVSIPLDPDTDRYPETGRWVPQDAQGRLLGTGLYLYLVEIVHADGTVTYSPVQKMVIQR